jgi:hypothetical protein
VEHDRTVILDKSIGDTDRAEELALQQSKELRGRLSAHGMEFDWRAIRLRGQWFVTVRNPTCSRSQLTEDDPINFALSLAKQAAETAMNP